MKVKVSKLIALFLTAVMILASFTVLGDEATKPIRERVKAAAMVKAGPKLTDEQKAEMKAKRLEALKENLDKRVAEGKLTQEQADEIYANAEEGKFPFGKREPLTEEQKAEMKAKRLETLKENLDKRVAEGKLTQEQADEIYAKAEEGKFPPVRMHKERKPLTEEQKAEMKSKTGERVKGGKGPMKKIGPRNGGMIRPKKAALEKATALKV